MKYNHALIPSQPSDNDPPLGSQLHHIPSLDPVWALDLHVRAQQEIDEGKIAEHCKEMECAVKQHFILNWFDADDEPVVMQWVLNCPFFPQYQLTDDLVLIESLGTDISKIDVYEECFARWIPAALSHTFTLTTGGHIFICCHGVTQCEGFDELYRVSKQSVWPPHMCSNMKGQCDALHAAAKQSLPTVTTNCDSDVEIIEVKPLRVTSRKATGKRRRYSTPGKELGAPASSHQCLYSQLAPPADTDMDIDIKCDVEIIKVVDFADCLASSLSPTPPLDFAHNSMSQSLSVSSSSTPLAAPSIISVHVPIYHADNK
ncbi:hypothetical protein BDR05DRAFT_996015 [Suillus weaverae]|nr:hypothetical protein BDR05DRAFT_996015 [Suillus weaverae]